jgi:hypothetical protein
VLARPRVFRTAPFSRSRMGAAGELYNPGSGSWTIVAGPFDDHTYVHTCTLLADGRVLVTSEQRPSTGGGPKPVAALFRLERETMSRSRAAPQAASNKGGI